MRYLSLNEYLDLAETLVRRERPDLVNDEDAISSVVEYMMNADKINGYEGHAERAAFRYINGKFGLKRYTSVNTGKRHIRTRYRRVEPMNVGNKVAEGDSLACEDTQHQKLVVNEIYDYVCSFTYVVREPFIRYFFMGDTQAEIAKSMGKTRRSIRALLDEGLYRVRKKFG